MIPSSNKKYWLFPILAIGIFFFSPWVFAQESGSEKQFVPCDTQCNLCHLIMMADRIYEYIFYLALSSAFLLLTAGGVLYIVSSANPDWKNTGKNLITTALIGFAILVFSWFIVNFLLVFMGVKSEYTDNWSKIKCDVPENIGETENL